VLRIDSDALRAFGAILLVGSRQKDEPMQALDGPATVHKGAGQVIEQLGVRRRLAAEAEIARRAHQAGTEMVKPDPVYEDPRRQGIAAIHYSPGQLEPATTTVAKGCAALAGSDGGHATGDGFPELTGIATHKDPRLIRHLCVNQDMCA